MTGPGQTPAIDGGAPITGYNVYRGTSSNSLSLFTTLGVELSYSDVGLPDDTIYWYAITALNAAGESPQSTPMSGASYCPVDTVSISITGSPTYTNEGTVTGNLEIWRNPNDTLKGVGGTGTIPGTQGGEATVAFNLHQFWILSLFIGNVSVSDPGAGVYLNAPSFFRPIGPAPGANAVTGTISWVNFGTWPWRPYTLTWTVDDET